MATAMHSIGSPPHARGDRLPLSLPAPRRAPPSAAAALKSLTKQYADTDVYLIARAYALRKDPDKTFEWLDRAWANRDNNISILYYDSILLRYKEDPRFAAFCRKVGLPTPAEVASDPKS